MSAPHDALRAAIDDVVANELCTGCGACSVISDRVELALDDSGFLRPRVAGEPSPDDDRLAALFSRVCPGLGTAAPLERGAVMHETLGPVKQAWQGYAADPDTRFAGGSGGAVTALLGWLVETGRVAAGITAKGQGRRSVPITLTTKSEALASAGSRYAPVSPLSQYVMGQDDVAVIAKPCEVAALRSLTSATGSSAPLTISFFCAGTPSQHASEALIESLGMPVDEVRSLRYRGHGWPGRFTAASESREVSTTYEQSWGAHLGRQLSWGCKLCPNGTGWHADIAVGDYWAADSQGYPVFTETEGNSIIIARTDRGVQAVRDAIEAGVLTVADVDLDAAARVQPLQRDRLATLWGRVLGRWLSGRRSPKFVGYGLFLRAVRHPLRNARTAVGTVRRTLL